MSQIVARVFLLIAIAAAFVCSEENVVQINLKKTLGNFASDKFISYSIDDSVLSFSQFPINNVQFTSAIKFLGPGYIRVPMTSNFFPQNERNKEVTSENSTFNVESWHSFYQWIQKIGFMPVFQFAYSPESWEPRDVLLIFKNAFKLNIFNCVWQLGIDFNGVNAEKYSEDIETLNLIINTFPSKVTNWTIATAEISFASDPEEIKKFTSLVKDTVVSVGWIEPTEISSDEEVVYTDYALQAIKKAGIPIWTTSMGSGFLSDSLTSSGDQTIDDGLNWALNLGYTTSLGFSNVYKNINFKEFTDKHFGYFVSLLFKKTVAGTSFDTRITQQATPRQLFQVFTFCSKTFQGSVTLMAINYGPSKIKITPKFSNRGSINEVNQYVLSYRNGRAYINNDLIGKNTTIIQPLIKSKRGIRQVNFVLPPYSVGFWELGHINCISCVRKTINENQISERSRMVRKVKPHSSVDSLLRDLIWKSIASEETQRNKRHLEVKNGGRKKRETAEMNLRPKRFILSPKFKTPNSGELMARDESGLRKVFKRINQQILSRPNIIRSKRDIGLLTGLKLKSNALKPLLSRLDDDHVFREVANPVLPKGDVYSQLKPDGSENKNKGFVRGDYDYVQFDEKESVKATEPVNKEQVVEKIEFTEAGNAAPQYAPQEYFESFGNQYGIIEHPPLVKAPINELWENENSYANTGKELHPVQPKLSARVEHIIKELPPTIRQDEENFRRASESARSFYIDPEDERQHARNMNLLRNNMRVEEEDDDLFFSRRAESRNNRHFKLLRGKRELDFGDRYRSQNQVLNAIEHVVDSIEQKDKNVKKFAVKIDGEKNSKASYRAKRSLDLSHRPRQTLINKIKDNYLQKPFPESEFEMKLNNIRGKLRFRRDISAGYDQNDIDEASSWESSELWNMIANDENGQENDVLLDARNLYSINDDQPKLIIQDYKSLKPPVVKFDSSSSCDNDNHVNLIMKAFKSGLIYMMKLAKQHISGWLQ